MAPTYPVPTASPYLALQAWEHPTTGALSMVRVDRDAQGFGIVRQISLYVPNEQPDFEDCQFGSL